MSALVEAALNAANYQQATARDITWSDRGRLCAVETDTGLYHGYLGSVIFHRSGRVALTLHRSAVKGDVTIDPDHYVAFHPTERDPEMKVHP